MNNLVSALCGIVNFMPPWIMLGVFGAIILLIVLILAFKGFKRVFFRILIYIFVGGMVFSYLGFLGIQVAQIAMRGDRGEILQLITFAISWGPTILFAVGVLIKVLRGVRRGLRKSLILALHATCAGVLCLAFFLVMVYVKEVDAASVSLVNWLAGENALQHMLGVPESCTTLKEVIAAYIPTLAGAGFEGLSPYIYTLVDLVYRLIFAVISISAFFVIDFILYIVYVLCYSQHKYKRYKKLEFKHGKTDRDYKKHWLSGGAVGLARGIVAGLLGLSFVGSTFYVVAGGKGEGTLEDHDFGNDDINYIYEIYRSVESYGAQGIFKVLNAISDTSDTPFYLFAADLVFSGELNDEEFEISENIKFREEYGALVGFARDAFNLLIKYGPDEVNAIVNGEVSDNAFDTVLEVMTRPGFKEDFDAVIDAFNDQSYFINLSMALVNTIVSHIDEISFTNDAIGESEKEIIKLVFKKGYLSANIPDESELMASTGKTEAEGENIRPYLTVKHLLNKNDVRLVLNVVLSMLAGEETGDTLQLVKRLVPEISKLSILSTERKANLNPVLGRLYCLVENMYLTEEGKPGVTYAEIAEDGIDWIGEIQSLFGAVDDVLVLYNNLIENSTEEEVDALKVLKTLFNKDDDNYTANIKAYNHICTLLTDSKALGRALSTSFVYTTITDAFKGVSENIYLSENISFCNVYDKDGNIVTHGEFYQLLQCVGLLFGENADSLDTLFNAGEETTTEEILNTISKVLETEDKDGKTLTSYLLESEIFRSLISIVLIETGADVFYVPEAALETVEGECVNLVTKAELSGLLTNMGDLVDFVLPFVSEGGEWKDNIDDYLSKDSVVYKLIKNNRIFEGTVARFVTQILNDTDVIVMPKALDTSENSDNISAWITVDGQQGELLNLLDVLLDAGFIISDIVGDEGEFDSKTVLDKVFAMEKEDLDKFFSSSVLHYTVSNFITDAGSELVDGFILVIPAKSCQDLYEDSIDRLIKKNELVSVFLEIKKLEINSDDISAEKILSKIASDKGLIKNSNIIAASIVATIVNNDGIPEDLIPAPYDIKNYGSQAALENYGDNNPWTDELPALIDALAELFGLGKEDNDFSFDNLDINGKVKELLLNMNNPADIDEGEEYPRTKLTVLHESVIFRNKITVEVDKILTPEIVDEFIITEVKSDGYYEKEELSKLCAAVNALELDSFDEEGFTVENVKEKLTVETLGTVYASTIVKGIVTKNLQSVFEKNDKICDHPLAYEEDLKVYRQSEIECLLSLFGDVEGGEVSIKNLGEYGQYYYDEETQKPKSYILVATTTRQLLTQTMFIIPREIYDSKNSIIYPEELKLFADALNTLLTDDKNSSLSDQKDWGNDTTIAIPSESKREAIFESIIIRARVTFQVRKDSLGVIAVKEGNGDVINDMREEEYYGVGQTTAISKDQLLVLVNALEKYKLDVSDVTSEFQVPQFDDAGEILDMCRDEDGQEMLKILFASDIIRYRICELLAEQLPLEKQDSLNLRSCEAEENYSVDADELITMINPPSD
ncbi:MAG: hypothetical protein K2K38_01605 [Clostridia bacterium]|nr:hypothetical protein [Clostridia bacterium]